MKLKQLHVWFLAVAAMMLMAGHSQAAEVVLYPGYISGNVSVKAAGYKARDISISSTGGGFTASNNVSGDSYSMTVQAGSWSHTVNAYATVSPVNATYPYTNLSFSPRVLPVAEGQTVENNYSAGGTVRFNVNITGDAYNYWVGYGSGSKNEAVGLERTSSSSRTANLTANASWDMPVVPNQQIKIAAQVYVASSSGGKYYDFYLSNDNLYKDVADGQTVVVDLNINHVAPTQPPLPTYQYGTLEGDIYLDLNIDGNSFQDKFGYHSGGVGYVPENPGAYRLVKRVGGYSIRPSTYFKNNPRLNWPYENGVASNNNVYVENGVVSKKNFFEKSGRVVGKLQFTGSLSVEKLRNFTIGFTGINQIFYPNSGWLIEPTMGGSSSGTYYPDGNSEGKFEFFLTPGGWNSPSVSFNTLNNDRGYTKNSQGSITDYQYIYDGKTYPLGRPTTVVAGETTIQNREYCLGTATLRFRVNGGGLLRNPSGGGTGRRYNAANIQELFATVSGSSQTSLMEAPEIDFHGPAMDYLLSNIYALAADGSRVSFTPMPLTLECGVTKIIDINGPELSVASPSAQTITNASSVPVSGKATDDVGISAISVNGNSAAFALTGNPQDAKEVSFSYDLSVLDGKNTITTVAVDANGNESSDKRDIFVDRWQPTVFLFNDDSFPVTETSIPFTAQAADQGYGFNVKFYLDGVLIGSKEGSADEVAPVAISHTGTLENLGLGSHTLTAVATDRAGNSTTTTANILIYEARDHVPPVISLVGNATVSVEVGDTYIDAGATALDDRDGDLTAAIVTVNPVNTQQLGSYLVTYNVADAAGNAAAEVARQVIVVDTTAPVLTLPATLILEATSPAGAMASFAVAAVDLVDPSPVVTCSSATGTVFPLGESTVTCSAADASGNSATGSFIVRVQDTTAPQLVLPENQIVEATSAAGAVVTFAATANDLADAAPVVSCSALSGGMFPLGTTAVNCSATDANGNSASGSFSVQVRDTTGPVLTVPANLTVLLNTALSSSAVQAFLNGATAVDVVDPEVAVTFTTPLLTSVGTKVVTFTATDDFGNSTTATAKVYVQYGCGTEFEPPVSLQKPFKLGSTIPVKLGLCDANGAAVNTAVPRLYLQQFSGTEPVGEPIEVTSTSGADTGNYFRLASDSMYIYNLYTKSLSSGTFQIQAVLDDGTTRTTPLMLKP